jgi:hypothetical protein
MTWREFYQYFAEQLDLDLSNVPVDPLRFERGKGLARRVLGWPLDFCGGIKQIVTSKEFKSLGRRVLETDPVGTFPRWTMERFPSVERAARKLVKADSSLPIYVRDDPQRPFQCRMGSGGALVSIQKAQSLLDFTPCVSRIDALQLTLDWVRHGRLID